MMAAKKFDFDLVKDDVLRAMMRNGDSFTRVLWASKGKTRSDIRLIREWDRAQRGRRGDGRTGDVEHLDVSDYRNLNRRARSGDEMQHDHIPSHAATVRALEERLGRRLTEAERRGVMNDGAAVELTDQLHALSRTYGGRNTPRQISLDAQDLAAATDRDLATLRENLSNANVPQSTIDEVIRGIRDQNARQPWNS